MEQLNLRNAGSYGHAEAVSVSVADHGGLPPAWYVSQEIYAREIERIFEREWLCVGRVDEVACPGDYLSVDALEEPLLVVRDEAGELRVLSRVCRHRSMILAEGAGNAKTFVCPYHNWTYALDGRLAGAPEMGKTPGFDATSICLPEVRHEVWEGFIFVNFDANATPLSPALSDLSHYVRNYDFADMKTVRSVEFDMDCAWNWKLMCDNYIEPYHHIGAHAKSLEPILPARDSDTLDLHGPHSVVTMRYRKGRSPVESPDDGTPRLPAIPGLSAEQQRLFVIIHIFPCGLIALYPDHMEFYRIFPHGPGRVRVEKLMCVPPSAMARPDFDTAMDRVVTGFIEFRDEDIETCLALQRALSSRFAEPGRLCHMEASVEKFARYVADRLDISVDGRT